jgi:hypothetical protein
MLIFSINLLSGSFSSKTIPVFACGNVPLDNFTYPQGLLLYSVGQRGLENTPRKLPVFPNRLRRWLVNTAPPIDGKMLHSTENRLAKMIRDGVLSKNLIDPLQKTLRERYALESTLALRNYSDQSVVLNSLIWKSLFTGTNDIPNLLYLELERIVIALLIMDLQNPESLVHQVLFHPRLRENVLSELDGTIGCWNQQKLLDRLNTSTKAQKGAGTVFFWGFSQTKRRAPLCLQSEASWGQVLRGVDDHNNVWEMPFNSSAIINGLQCKTLLPSLFTCFLALSFARGVCCAGGYYQCDYLPEIQRGLAAALVNTTDCRSIAPYVLKAPTDHYLSGMIAVMIESQKDCLTPCGPLEILAGGGLTEDDVRRISDLTVREAHLAGLHETIPDVLPPKMRQAGWQKELASSCFKMLRRRVVVKGRYEGL